MSRPLQSAISSTLLLAVVCLGCSRNETSTPIAKPQVYTTFSAPTYFVQRIAGEHVDVVCPLPADGDPIFWMPSSQTIAAYQKADLIVVNGAGFERWVEKVSLPTSRIVDTAAPLADQWLKYEGAVTHSHGTAERHSHEGVDGHTWLDPNQAKVQAAEIRRALIELVPEAADEFRANYAALAADLDELDRSLRELSQILGDTPLLASHPAYNYPARRYGWNLTNLSLDPAVMPDDAALDEIRRILAAAPARVLLWESPPTDEMAARFREDLGLASVVFSPCELLEDGEDYIAVMRENVARLREAVGME